MTQDALSEFVERFRADHSSKIRKDDIVRWAGSLSNWAFYNEISINLAWKYQSGELSYTVCDSIMNELWNSVLDGLAESAGDQVPYPFYEVYEAFDAGEFYRHRDKSDAPVKDHTDPMISELLAKYTLSRSS
ncbi:hypothetical protein [Oricola indica]|jgi:hypothetical protein|uniref:hypothetical protein n=1 Tax=Oricola indica TaxID=2872591 RepID=UPI001CC0D260|nr:hypothetical protein [Oricola indica]